MIREAIARVSSGTDLTPPEATGVMEEIMQGAATPAPDRRVPHGAADEGGDRNRDRGVRQGDAGCRRPGLPPGPGGAGRYLRDRG
ncbi:protein of unknown function [Methanoculleus bourgensis]|uniref:Anthranilate phosphoribosyltransferase n=1 Tax=Methanoculleus bourgensis TaxID=83986 RepID=A0A0X3BM48_9EURY|nr:protein of unknown function [Methanoculleus bourgensis]